MWLVSYRDWESRSLERGDDNDRFKTYADVLYGGDAQGDDEQTGLRVVDDAPGSGTYCCRSANHPLSADTGVAGGSSSDLHGHRHAHDDELYAQDRKTRSINALNSCNPVGIPADSEAAFGRLQPLTWYRLQ